MQKTTGSGTQSRHPQFQRFGDKNVICIQADSSLVEAAKLMADHQIGDVVVVEKTRPIGIITDRDLVVKTLAKGLKPEALSVSDCMTESMATASQDDDIFTMVKIMKECGVSRLPLVDEKGALCGIVSAKNLFQALTACLDNLAQISKQQQENERIQEH